MTEFQLQTLADQLQSEILANRLFDVPAEWSDELTFPRYDDLSLRNIPHTIADLLGAPLAKSHPIHEAVWGGKKPQAERVITFLLDGAGYKHLQMLMDEDEELREIMHDLTQGRGMLPTTSIAPTTTAVALTTLWTGGAPATTGMLGTGMYLREFWQVGNMLAFSPMVGKNIANGLFPEWGVDPADMVGSEGIGDHLSHHKIPTYVVTHRMLWRTGLSKILHRGVERAFLHAGYNDFYLRLEDAMRETVGKSCYIGIYYPGVDTLAHEYGAHNHYTHHEIKANLRSLRDLLNKPEVQDGQTVFMLTADHGHYDAPHRIDLQFDERAKAIRDACVVSASGDARLTQLHVRDGKRDQIKDIVDQYFADSLTYIDADQAIAQGLYGTDEIHPETMHRLGDIILIPRLGWIVEDPSISRLPLISWHGGLSDWEMITPFIWRTL